MAEIKGITDDQKAELAKVADEVGGDAMNRFLVSKNYLKQGKTWPQIEFSVAERIIDHADLFKGQVREMIAEMVGEERGGRRSRETTPKS